MTSILVRVGPDGRGAAVLDFLRTAIPGAELRVAGDWRAVIDAFYPTNPRVLLVEATTIDDQGAQLLQDVRRETPWVPVIVLGAFEELEPGVLVGLAASGVTTFVDPAAANGSTLLREAFQFEGGVAGRAAAALRRHWVPGIPSAQMMAAVDFALQRSTVKLDVDGMAEVLGVSRRTLRRILKLPGAPPPSRLLRWGRVLWAAHDLEADPAATGEAVAEGLGFASDNSLRDALAKCLGVGVRGAREMGLDGALKRFVKEFDRRSRQG
jgi:AraC-like DNA-binding protein